jgi:hypothetical protein
MSTAIESNTFLRGSEDYNIYENSRLAFYPEGGSFGKGADSEIRFAPVTRKPSQPENKQKSRVLRRMAGLLTEIQGKNARVTFFENKQSFEYAMPAETLLKSGIKAINQPFQMDEVEIQMGDGLVVGYHFRPLAKESDAYTETLSFNDERKKKLELILKKFAKAKT